MSVVVHIKSKWNRVPTINGCCADEFDFMLSIQPVCKQAKETIMTTVLTWKGKSLTM